MPPSVVRFIVPAVPTNIPLSESVKETPRSVCAVPPACGVHWERLWEIVSRRSVMMDAAL